MNIEEVWPLLRQRQRVARHGWSGKGQWLQIVQPDARWASGGANAAAIHSADMTLPYVAVWTCAGHWVPWVASQKDLLEHDWYVVKDSDVPRGTPDEEVGAA